MSASHAPLRSVNKESRDEALKIQPPYYPRGFRHAWGVTPPGLFVNIDIDTVWLTTSPRSNHPSETTRTLIKNKQIKNLVIQEAYWLHGTRNMTDFPPQALGHGWQTWGSMHAPHSSLLYHVFFLGVENLIVNVGSTDIAYNDNPRSRLPYGIDIRWAKGLVGASGHRYITSWHDAFITATRYMSSVKSEIDLGLTLFQQRSTYVISQHLAMS